MPSGPSTRATTVASSIGDHAGAVDDRPAELIGEPDPDLEVAGVRGVVAEQDQVVAAAVGLVCSDDRGDLAGHVGRAESSTRSASTNVAAVAPTASAERELLDRVGVAQRQHGGLRRRWRR